MKTKTVFIFCMTALILLVVGGYIFVTFDANKKASKLSEAIKNYKFIEEELTTGKKFDLAKDKIKGVNFKIDEGKLFLDYDHDITIFSDIEINGLVCKGVFDKPNCSIFNSKNGFLPEYRIYREYKIEDEVTLLNGSKWRVIHDSPEESKYVILMNQERIDINYDGVTISTNEKTDPDRIPFDTTGSKKYDESKPENVGFYLENTYKTILDMDGIYDFRLLTLDELEALKERIGFTNLTDMQKLDMMSAEEEVLDSIMYYYESPRPFHKLKDIVITPEQDKKLMPHWLFNSKSGNFWVMDGSSAKTAVWDGNGYTKPKATTGYSLKPVMVISKDSIKE